jgi:hypothetical protein
MNALTLPELIAFRTHDRSYTKEAEQIPCFVQDQNRQTVSSLLLQCFCEERDVTTILLLYNIYYKCLPLIIVNPMQLRCCGKVFDLFYFLSYCVLFLVLWALLQVLGRAKRIRLRDPHAPTHHQPPLFLDISQQRRTQFTPTHSQNTVFFAINPPSASLHPVRRNYRETKQKNKKCFWHVRTWLCLVSRFSFWMAPVFWK